MYSMKTINYLFSLEQNWSSYKNRTIKRFMFLTPLNQTLLNRMPILTKEDSETHVISFFVFLTKVLVFHEGRLYTKHIKSSKKIY